MITVIKKIIIIKDKEGKRQGKKNAYSMRLVPGTFFFNVTGLPLGHEGPHDSISQKALI